ncbi:MAG: PIN domain-containing protein [Bdellovibrionales bacterium]
MKRAVFDTDAIVHYSKDVESVVDIVLGCEERYISFTTWVEFLVGFPLADQQRARQFLDNNFTIIPCDAKIANFVIDIRRETRLKYADATIYATAKYLRAPLVTCNAKDFKSDWEDVYIPKFAYH